MIGGNRNYRKTLIAYFNEEWIHYPLRDTKQSLKHIRCILNLASTGNLRFAFNNGDDNKQMALTDPSRYYLKIKSLKIEPDNKESFDSEWIDTGIDSDPPDKHTCIMILLCVKHVFFGTKNLLPYNYESPTKQDLELPLVTFGISPENDVAKVFFPDRVFSVYSNFKNIAHVSSESTLKLSMNEHEKIIELLDLLMNNPSYDLNSSQFGHTVTTSSDFTTFIINLFNNFKGLNLLDSLRNYTSKLLRFKNTSGIAQYLLQEYEYYKDNKSTLHDNLPCQKETLEPTISSQSSQSPQLTQSDFSPMSDDTIDTIDTVVGEKPIEYSPVHEPEPGILPDFQKCISDNPCLQVVYNKILQDLKQTQTKAGIHKTKKKSKKRKSKHKKSKKRKSKRKKSKRKKTKRKKYKR